MAGGVAFVFFFFFCFFRIVQNILHVIVESISVCKLYQLLAQLNSFHFDFIQLHGIHYQLYVNLPLREIERKIGIEEIIDELGTDYTLGASICKF